MAGARPLRTDLPEPRAEPVGPATETDQAPAVRDVSIHIEPGRPRLSPSAPRTEGAPEPLLVVALVLIGAGIVWAAIRGLHFYGLAPIDVAYDLDQPPLLLILVGGWLAHRSRRR
jgi:hypothetical protein